MQMVRLDMWIEEGQIMKFYTIKLPKFLGGLVRAMLGSLKKNNIAFICLM